MHLQEYIPTVIILSPNIGKFFYAMGGLVLDGHHKIQAAAETGSPIRVILIEQKEDKFGFYHDTSIFDKEEKRKEIPLYWSCDKEYAVSQWKRLNNNYYQRKKLDKYLEKLITLLKNKRNGKE